MTQISKLISVFAISIVICFLLSTVFLQDLSHFPFADTFPSAKIHALKPTIMHPDLSLTHDSVDAFVDSNKKWASEPLALETNTLHLFFGETRTTTANSSGFGELGFVVFPDNTVSGFFNHDNYPGQPLTCAASDVSGTLIGNRLDLSFFIYDPSPGCDSLNGVEETFSGKILKDGTRLWGTFSATGHTGTWDLTRTN